MPLTFSRHWLQQRVRINWLTGMARISEATQFYLTTDYIYDFYE